MIRLCLSRPPKINEVAIGLTANRLIAGSRGNRYCNNCYSTGNNRMINTKSFLIGGACLVFGIGIGLLLVNAAPRTAVSPLCASLRPPPVAASPTSDDCMETVEWFEARRRRGARLHNHMIDHLVPIDAKCRRAHSIRVLPRDEAVPGRHFAIPEQFFDQ